MVSRDMLEQNSGMDNTDFFQMTGGQRQTGQSPWTEQGIGQSKEMSAEAGA